MENPILNTISVLFYLYIVKIAGPAFMKDRKPYEFRRILFVYNMVLVGLSGWMFYEVRFTTLNLKCSILHHIKFMCRNHFMSLK